MFLGLLVLLAAPADARRTSDVHEARALTEELRVHATRGRWEGVERTYLDMVDLGLPLKADTHLLGADAAWARGDVHTARERLRAAAKHTVRVDIEQRLRSIDGAYGRLTVISGERLLLHTGSLDTRVVRFATETLADAGTFDGLVPAGVYRVDGQRVEVVAGAHVEVEPVGRKRGRNKDKRRQALDQFIGEGFEAS